MLPLGRENRLSQKRRRLSGRANNRWRAVGQHYRICGHFEIELFGLIKSAAFKKRLKPRFPLFVV
jgi:hypothetical protein